MRSAAEVWERGSARLTNEVRDYLMGGAGSERAIRSNREAVESLALLPHVLTGVQEASAATHVLSTTVDVPVFCAPVGSLELFASGAAWKVLRATAATGCFAMPGILAIDDLATVKSVRPATAVLQIYLRGDDGWLDELLREVERAGFVGLCVTVDSPVPAYRPRDRRNAFEHRARLGPASNVSNDLEGRAYQARVTWERLAALRQRTEMPLGVKGVLRASDAARAVELGFDFVYVSNHGGRNIGATPAPIDMLPGIVAEVRGRAAVFVDGGFRDGEDVAKALALGASAVGLGRAHCLALAADGQEGLEVLLQEIGMQLRTTMALLGASTVAHMDRELVAKARLGGGPPVSTSDSTTMLAAEAAREEGTGA